MIASRLNYRPGSIRLVLVILLFLLSAMTLGAALAHVATQIVPVGVSACVPSIVPGPAVPSGLVSAPVVPILTIKPAVVDASLPAVDKPKPLRPRYAKAVHGRMRGRFATRD